MISKTLTYSIVIPVYNNAATLLELFHKIQTTLTQLDKEFEVLFVDDRSQDESWEKLQEIKSKYPEIVHIIRLTKNFGQHNATLVGLKNTRADFIITIDADLQFHPSDITKLVGKQEESNADLVIGQFQSTFDFSLRSFGTWLVNKSMVLLFGLNLPTDATGSSFRLIQSDLAKKVCRGLHSTVFIDIPMIRNAQKLSLTNVAHQKRKTGKSGYSLTGLMVLLFRLIATYSQPLVLGLLVVTISILTASLCFLIIPDYSSTTNLTVVFVLTLILLLAGTMTARFRYKKEVKIETFA